MVLIHRFSAFLFLVKEMMNEKTNIGYEAEACRFLRKQDRKPPQELICHE